MEPKINPLKIDDLPSYIGKRVCVSRGTPLNPMKENRNGILKYATPDAIGIEGEDGSFRTYRLVDRKGKLTTVRSLD